MLCAEDNIRVVYPTTAAQYFHVLRRQVHDPTRKPLIVMTPKRYLRMPATVSPVERVHRRRLPARARRPANPTRDAVRRLVFCTGKFGHELHRAARRDAGAGRDRAARAALPVARARDRRRSSRATRTPRSCWAQEEPGNMGARYFARRRIEEIARRPRRSASSPGPTSPSPASGSSTVHDAEQAAAARRRRSPCPERRGGTPRCRRRGGTRSTTLLDVRVVDRHRGSRGAR